MTYEYAIEDFQSAIMIGGGSEPALKKIAEGLLRLAQAQLQHHTDVLSRLKQIGGS